MIYNRNFALVLKCDPVYLQQTFKMMLLYFVLNRPLKSINHNKVSFVLYLIAKLCTISSISNPLFEAAFQICVYFVSSTEISPALTLRYCGIIYEFCCKNQLYCPEIIDSFTRLVKSQT
ncbi:hypothetical protein RF11_14887 [Thelohanellus kitauei]|uniref:Uncharacterized protein n=1 Tax=Thelohanellus kitauei TaxID=669202 RepID=A0A0C2MKY8_THEKT|nr:hypothetical protein RF11_14887 [Thelohanellus kitauei]